MKVNFKIRKGKKTNTILLDFRHGRTIRYRTTTGLTIRKGSEKYWDAKKGKIKKPNDINNSDSINKQLNEWENDIEKAIINLINDNKLSQLNCVREIKKIIKGESEEEQDSSVTKTKVILDFFDWFVKYYSKNNSPTTNKPLTSGTIRTYKNSRNYLSKFLKFKGYNKFSFEDVDEQFYHDFISFGKTRNYSLNYIGSNIQKLKTIISYAYDKGVHKNQEFKKRYFSKFSEEINHPYLNEVELEKIRQLKLSCKIEDNIRDVFLVGCYTGLRVGDLTKFLKNPKTHKKGDKYYIKLNQNKTGNEVYVPINSNIEKVLNKRNGKFPDYIHQNKLNAIIKSIAKRAKITTDYTLEKTLGNEKVSITKPKYKFVSSHTARRSFCTNAYNAGVPPHLIMVISGHKSEKVFDNYIKADSLRKAMQAADYSYFQ
ncbi:tyrosine-type recombinase/integrase [Psychroflexus planctonicus]|uniref:Integrase n=1 Tax=Psychroflexus planctonicus TaxID=1526575 RepID=A0ABQ1SH24_9FLAO|nr:phage integrase SAM-like domain-containing protein [Psychroflexus planctonicus]GGE31656.1 integrase [Psychroflexus planctonicus]